MSDRMSKHPVIMMGQPGKLSVEEASQILKRLYWIEREVMRTLGGYLVSIANWDMKKLIPKHVWQDSLRADALRRRVLEMRYPRRDVDQGHDEGLQHFLSMLIRCTNDAELLEGVYFIVKQELQKNPETWSKQRCLSMTSPCFHPISGLPFERMS